MLVPHGTDGSLHCCFKFKGLRKMQEKAGKEIKARKKEGNRC
jgi:hypothetical protein